jgi:Protein of unknown function (DUF4232)
MSVMRTSLAGAAVLAAVALSACGASGGGGQTTPGSQPAAATGSQTTSGATTSATQTPTAGTSTSGTPTATQSGAQTGTQTGNSGGAAVSGDSGSDQCKAAGLALSYLGGQGATGHAELGFALKNTGSAPCSTGGYPGIQFLSQGGSALPTTPQHTTDDFFGHLPLTPLTLQPGQTASFRLGVSHGGGSSAPCNTADALQVIAPNDTATLSVQIPNGASECGTTTVSPLQPGTSAFQ